MYDGTSGRIDQGAENGGKAGAAYRIRTCDPIITNMGYPWQTAPFLATSVLISPICAVFVRVSSHESVHEYIGPMRDANLSTGPDHQRIGVRNG